MYVFLTDSVFFIFKYKLCTIFKKLLLFRATITLICSILIIFWRTGGKKYFKSLYKETFSNVIIYDITIQIRSMALQKNYFIIF